MDKLLAYGGTALRETTTLIYTVAQGIVKIYVLSLLPSLDSFYRWTDGSDYRIPVTKHLTFYHHLINKSGDNCIQSHVW